MKNKKLIIASIALISSNALAAGYSTNSTSTSALATSYAGSSTGAHDISNMYHNPAILSKFNKSQFVIGLTYLDVDIDPQSEKINGISNNAAGEVGDAGVDVFIPSFYFATPIDKKNTIGFAANSPFGLATEYNTNWVGATLANDSEIKTINLETNISHQLTKELSLGLGINSQKLQYTATFNYPGSNAYTKFKGSDWGYGYSLGLNYDLSDRLSFGAGYKSAIKYEVSGKYQTLGTAQGAVLKLKTPERANIGAKYEFNDRLNLMSDIVWTRWSRNRAVDINNSTTGTNLVPITSNWHDSFLYSLGGDYQYNDNLLVRFGGAFETGASDDQYRNPDVPSGDVYWLNAGINYDFGNDLSLDATYLHQFYENVKVNKNDLGGSNIQAKYRTQVNLFSIALKKNF